MAVEAISGIEWLQSLTRFGIRPGLERTRRVLAAFGNPEEDLMFYHVAGTNGKGSVCAFLTSLLSVKLRVGTFTSPAFDGYRGRFVVAGEQISETAFQALAETVRETANRETPADPLTEFEALTVMAILYFAAEHVEAVVWETGLGGRFDSTNVVHPYVTAITNVGYDHVEVLGPTLRDIAAEKAGIIKAGVPCFTAARGEALQVIRNAALKNDASLFVQGVDFAGTRRTIDRDGIQHMDYRGSQVDLFDVPVPLFGLHQIENAAVALAIHEFAVASGGAPALSPDELRQALRCTRWSGRFEVLPVGNQVVVLDGAHNPEGAQTLASALYDFRHHVRHGSAGWTMVIGILRDKKAPLMLKTVLPYAARVIVTEPATPRARNATELSNLIKACRNDIEVCIVSSVATALRMSLQYAEDVCCWGSLYTVHEARNAIKQSAEFWK